MDISIIEKHKQMRIMILVMAAIIVLLLIVLVINYFEIQNFKEIVGGTYFTEQQCEQMYSLTNLLNLNLSTQ